MIWMIRISEMRTLEQGGKFVQSVKHGCSISGLPAGAVRKPLRGLTKEDKRELEMVVETLRTTIAHITGIPKPEASNVVALNA